MKIDVYSNRAQIQTGISSDRLRRTERKAQSRVPTLSLLSTDTVFRMLMILKMCKRVRCHRTRIIRRRLQPYEHIHCGGYNVSTTQYLSFQKIEA